MPRFFILLLVFFCNDIKFGTAATGYDSGTMGTLVVRQEGEKLIALTANGERIELVPEAADRFIAQPVGAAIRFEQEASGKVIAIYVTPPDGREIKGSTT